MKPPPTLTTTQVALTFFIFFPLSAVISVWSWTVLWNWWVEPILHFHMTYAFAAGFGTFYAYYSKRATASQNAEAVAEWFQVWSFRVMFPLMLVGIGWLIHHFWLGL